jgi:hypothetical protein
VEADRTLHRPNVAQQDRLAIVSLTSFLFDLDGTIIDSVKLIERSYRARSCSKELCL